MSSQHSDNHNPPEDHHPTQKVFFVNNKRFETDADSLSVRVLLVDYAKDDPAVTTLELKKGDDLLRFDNLDEQVEIKNGMHFVVFHNEPTPVS